MNPQEREGVVGGWKPSILNTELCHKVVDTEEMDKQNF